MKLKWNFPAVLAAIILVLPACGWAMNGVTGERWTDYSSGGIGHESNAVRFSLGFKF